MSTFSRRRFRRALVVGVVVSMGTASLVVGPVAAAPAPPSAHVSGLLVRDVVHDPLRDVVYASVDETDATYPNQVVTIDPDTHVVLAAVSLGTIPSEMAITDDGSALFVGIDGRGEIAKVSLPDFTLEWAHVLGPYVIWNTVAGDVAALPGSSDVVAVSRRVPGISPEHAGVVIVDGSGVRRDITAGHIGSDSIVFDDAGTRVFGSDLCCTGQNFFTHQVGPDGIVTDGTHSSIGGGSLAFHQGHVFQSNGAVIDVTGAAPRLADTVIGGRSIAVDEAAGVFYIGSIGFGRDLRAYDLDTRALVDEWTVSVQTGWASELVVLGTRSVALIDRSHPVSRFGRLLFVGLDPPPATPDPPPAVPDPPSPNGDEFGSLGEYTPLTPQRILDTRSGLGRGGLIDDLGPGESIHIPVTGLAGVPLSGVDAVVINVTATVPTESSYLTIWPSGLVRPTISSLNLTSGRTVANLVTMPVGADGRVSVFNAMGHVEVIFDIAGFYSSTSGPDGMRFTALHPTRALDTRTAPGRAMGAQESRLLMVPGTTPVPWSARAVALNVTVTGPTATSFLSVFPADVPQPVVSNLNFTAGDTRANQVIVRLPPSGLISIYNHLGSTHVVVDVVGYYDDVEQGDLGRFIALEPYRSLDTRIDSPWPSPGRLPAGATLQLVDDSVVVSAFVMNVTVTDTLGSGYVTAFPIGDERVPPPLASTLNYVHGDTVPNHAIVPAAPDVAFYNSGGDVHLVVDVFGVFI